MSNEEKILTLTTDLQTKCRAFIFKANAWLLSQPKWSGHGVLITQAKRSYEFQAGLFSEGREWDSYSKTWHETNPSLVVTRTVDSKHCQGKAFDIALTKNAKVSWPEDNDLWNAFAGIAETLGLEAGFRWSKPDKPHYQLA